MASILIIEDDKSIQQVISDNLEIEGHRITCASSGKAGLSFLSKHTYDLILLDIMLPEMHGFEVLTLMRARKIVAPVIILSAKNEEVDKVKGLDLGANDYITKPFGLLELIARVNVALRNNHTSNFFKQRSNVFQIGNVHIDLDGHTIINKNQSLPISKKEADILKLLIKNLNKTVSRQEIIQQVWGEDQFPTTRTVDNKILGLRKKIETNPSQPQMLISIHGLGYKLTNIYSSNSHI